jgi:hypothetical protein
MLILIRLTQLGKYFGQRSCKFILPLSVKIFPVSHTKFSSFICHDLVNPFHPDSLLPGSLRMYISDNDHTTTRRPPNFISMGWGRESFGLRFINKDLLNFVYDQDIQIRN